MSYDVYMTYSDKKECLVPHHEEGGTYALGGSNAAWMNITWNYGQWYQIVLGQKGIREIYGKTGLECQKLLSEAVERLGTHRANDYWKSTAGNAGYALTILLRWSILHPEAVFNGD